MRSWKHTGILVGMVALLMLALGAAASASTGQDGPVPPEVGDPVNATQVVPHGGYSLSTNFCLQCHDVHDATGAYALMANASVTATCQTCHSVAGGGTAQPDGGPDPDGSGNAGDGANANALGTVSLRTVYDAGTAANDAASVHTIGRSGVPGSGTRITQSDWDYDLWTDQGGPTVDSGVDAGGGTASQLGGGLYCASCHTPHGNFGQMVNMWSAGDVIQYDWPADEPTGGDPAGWADAYVQANGGSWNLCRDAGMTNCTPATIQDAEDQRVSLYGYKLLSAYPNHTYSTQQSYNIELHNLDSASWCTTCHTSNDLDGPNHNHQSGCNACHGNPVGDPTSADFPHTSSVGDFLIDYPDALCISCHTAGSLP